MNPRHTFTKSTHLENEYPIDAKVCPEKRPFKPFQIQITAYTGAAAPPSPERICGGTAPTTFTRAGARGDPQDLVISGDVLSLAPIPVAPPILPSPPAHGPLAHIHH